EAPDGVRTRNVRAAASRVRGSPRCTAPETKPASRSGTAGAETTGGAGSARRRGGASTAATVASVVPRTRTSSWPGRRSCARRTRKLTRPREAVARVSGGGAPLPAPRRRPLGPRGGAQGQRHNACRRAIGVLQLHRHGRPRTCDRRDALGEEGGDERHRRGRRRGAGGGGGGLRSGRAARRAGADAAQHVRVGAE